MSAIATAIVGGAVVGAVASNKAAGKAADAQQAAADSSNATQLEMYNQSREDQKPWLDTGENALLALAKRVGLNGGSGDLMRSFGAKDFTADPGYQFRRDEGAKAVTNSATARGGVLSGAAGKALARYNQDFASNEFGNAFNRFQTNQTNQFNRLASLAGVGQTAANQNANSAMQVGQNIGNNLIGAGNARASGYIATGNAINNALGQGVNWWQQQQYMNNPSNAGYWGGNMQAGYAGYGAGGGRAGDFSSNAQMYGV